MDDLRSRSYAPLVDACDNTLTGQQGDYQEVEFKLIEGRDGHVVHIRSPLLQENNYLVSVKGSCLSLIINEKRELVKSSRSDIFQKYLPRTQVYERLKSFKYSLPNCGLRIVASAWNTVEKQLEVSLEELN